MLWLILLSTGAEAVAESPRAARSTTKDGPLDRFQWARALRGGA
jgi:hypothetical protein